MGTCQMFSRKSKELRVARVQWAKGQVVGAEVGQLWGAKDRGSDRSL